MRVDWNNCRSGNSSGYEKNRCKSDSDLTFSNDSAKGYTTYLTFKLQREECGNVAKENGDPLARSSEVLQRER